MKIVVLDGYTLNPGDLSWSSIKRQFAEITTFDVTPPEKLIERAQEASILVVNKLQITKEIIAQLPKLKFIAASATGVNNIDLEACAANNILVSNIRNYGSANVAQHVFALILALTNKVEHHHQLVEQGEWLKSGEFSYWSAPIIELADKTIGIIGWGNIAQKVAQIALGFDMKVVYYSKSGQQSNWATAVDLDTLLELSDFVSINTHLNALNQNLVDRVFLSKMKPSAFLINTARGGLIKETDLEIALKKDVIAGAGLDVLCEEPPPNDHPLLHLNNCIVTPHNAWASQAARQRLMNMLAENIQAFIDGKPINLVV